MEILSLHNDMTPDQTIEFLKKKEPSIKIKKIETIYYPYFKMSASVYAKVLTRNINANISCLVDLVNGVEAITDHSCKKEKIIVDDSKVLGISMKIEEAKDKAFMFIRHVIIHKMKLLKTPKIIPFGEEIFYKPFWVIFCGNSYDEEFHLLVDSITGQFHLLSL